MLELGDRGKRGSRFIRREVGLWRTRGVWPLVVWRTRVMKDCVSGGEVFRERVGVHEEFDQMINESYMKKFADVPSRVIDPRSESSESGAFFFK
jgi:hypothetical protein